MRLRLGGKIGPIRAGVSVGRRGVGWGGGIGPVGVTGGTGGRKRSGSVGHSTGNSVEDGVEFAPITSAHPEDSKFPIFLLAGSPVLIFVAIAAVASVGDWDVRTPGRQVALGYWVFLGVSLVIPLIGISLLAWDRWYFKKMGRFRPNFLEGSRDGECDFWVLDKGRYTFVTGAQSPLGHLKRRRVDDSSAELAPKRRAQLEAFLSRTRSDFQNNANVSVADAADSSTSIEWEIVSGVAEEDVWKNRRCMLVPTTDYQDQIAVRVWEAKNVLIGGGSASGKSTFLRFALLDVLRRATPDEVRILLFDHALVGLSPFSATPHVASMVFTNVDQYITALGWVNKEIDRRYDVFVDAAVRSLDALNDKRDDIGADELPEIALIIDDVPLSGNGDHRAVWDQLQFILARGPRAGVRVVLAASSGTLMAMPDPLRDMFDIRIAMSTRTESESRRILGMRGAEDLNFLGEALHLQLGSRDAQKFSFGDVDEREIADVVNHWRRQSCAPAVIGFSVKTEISQPTTQNLDDELLIQAINLVVTSGIGSTSMLQRKLKVGFARAGGVMDQLEEMGVVGPADGAKARTVLITPNELALLSNEVR